MPFCYLVTVSVIPLIELYVRLLRGHFAFAFYFAFDLLCRYSELITLYLPLPRRLGTFLRVAGGAHLCRCVALCYAIAVTLPYRYHATLHVVRLPFDFTLWFVVRVLPRLCDLRC